MGVDVGRIVELREGGSKWRDVAVDVGCSVVYAQQLYKKAKSGVDGGNGELKVVIGPAQEVCFRKRYESKVVAIRGHLHYPRTLEVMLNSEGRDGWVPSVMMPDGYLVFVREVV